MPTASPENALAELERNLLWSGVVVDYEANRQAEQGVIGAPPRA
jgi:hypothetical protein